MLTDYDLVYTLTGIRLQPETTSMDKPSLLESATDWTQQNMHPNAVKKCVESMLAKREENDVFANLPWKALATMTGWYKRLGR